MEAIACIEGRRSVRKFKEQSIDHEIMERIIETARFAPSWKNTQTARYVVIENDKLKEKLANEAVLGFEHNAAIIKEAPALVVVTCIHGRSGFERDGSFSTDKEDRWEVFDAGIATQTFCLAAHANGISSVIMGIFDDVKVKELADIPDNQVVCALVATGYAAEECVAPKRKTVEDLISYR